jgi:hypothetical protein
LGKGWLGREEKGEIRINARAKSSLPFLTIPTSPIGDVERHYYSISLLEEGNSSAGFNYNSHVFVALLVLAAISSLFF